MNLAQVLGQTFRKHVDKTALIFEGCSYRFREIDEEIRKRALWLRKAGVRKRDHVAIQLPKETEFIFLHLAVLSMGAVSLPLNPGYLSKETAYFLSDSGENIRGLYNGFSPGRRENSIFADAG